MSSMDHFRLFPDDPDRLLRFKAEAEQREAELAAERKRKARVEQRTLLRTDIEGLRSEVAAIYGLIRHQHDVLLEVCGTALGQYGDKIFDHCEGMIQSVQRELFALVEKRFAEVQAGIAQARADAIATAEGKRAAKGEFRFAGEKGAEGDDEPVDLPQLSKARGLN